MLAEFLGEPLSQMNGWELMALYRKYEGRTLGVGTGSEIHVQARGTWKSLLGALLTTE